MTKQRVGEAKRKKASEITGTEYIVCFARGGRPKVLLDCWFGPKTEDGYLRNMDWVNIRTGEWEIGQRWEPEE